MLESTIIFARHSALGTRNYQSGTQHYVANHNACFRRVFSTVRQLV